MSGHDERRGSQEPVAVRLGLSVIATCTIALALYPILRVAQAIVFPEPDPAHVLWSEHAGFFWRGWTVFYVGGMGGFLAWLSATRAAHRLSRLLAWAIPVAAALLTAQALFFP